MIEQLLDSKVCLSCLGCCRFREAGSAWAPAFLKEEVSAAKAHKIPAGAIAKNNKLMLTHNAGQDCYVCVFLDTSTNFCSIYAHRPFECQLYPFVLNREKDKVYVSLDRGCPFGQQHLDSALLKSYVSRLERYFCSARIKAILRNNPQVIQSYENVTNLFELKLD